MRRVTVVLSLVLLGLPIGQTAAARPLIEGQRGWDCRTMGNRTCATGVRIAELAAIVEGQSGWDCRTMGNGTCGSSTTSEELASLLALPALGGTIERVSVSSTGEEANDHSSGGGFDDEIDVSRDGRYVVFISRATNLVPGDTNGLIDVFVRDRLLGTTERVNVSSSGDQADTAGLSGSPVHDPAISANGRFVAFSSNATNLVDGDANGVTDIFVRDRRLGRTERVSVGPDGEQGNAASRAPDISADGRYVAFESEATNLSPDEILLTTLDPIAGDAVESVGILESIADTRNSTDIFVRDRQAKTTERMSVNGLGFPGRYSSCEDDEACGDPHGHSWGPSISADGRFVAFTSGATNLIVDPTRATGLWLWEDDFEAIDVFVRDRLRRTTERITPNEGSGFGEGVDGKISGNGRFVVFMSGPNVNPFQHSCPGRCITVHDRSSGISELADPDVSSTRTEVPSINDNGSVVAFVATPPLAENPTFQSFVYLRNRPSATTDQIAVGSFAGAPGLSGDGRTVAFRSGATDLVPEDTNGKSDIFVYTY